MKIEKIRTDSYSILKISKYDFLVKLIKEIGNFPYVVSNIYEDNSTKTTIVEDQGMYINNGWNETDETALYISECNSDSEIRVYYGYEELFSYFLIYYFIIVTSLLATLFVRKNSLFTELKSIMMNASTAGAYATMLILLLLFANIIFLLSLTLFNNTNLAISVSLLFFLGGEVIANMIKARVNFASERIDNSVLTIFTKSFNNLNQYITFNLATFLPVVLNIIGLVIVIYIVRFIKKIFG